MTKRRQPDQLALFAVPRRRRSGQVASAEPVETTGAAEAGGAAEPAEDDTGADVVDMSKRRNGGRKS